jgi:hypothetical protein
MDVGIKLKGEEPTERLTRAGSWNSMVTHRVRIADAAQLDADSWTQNSSPGCAKPTSAPPEAADRQIGADRRLIGR